MTALRAIPLPILTDNYVWLLADAADRVVIIDPGIADPVFRAVASGLQPQAILITHHHPDHIGGIAELQDAFDLPCYAPADARIPHAGERVADGQRFRIEAMSLDVDVLAVPGHTRSHVAYLSDDVLFCGDTLFSLGCGRLFEGSAAQMLASLDRLAALPGGTRVCCAHEYTLANGRFARIVEPDNAARDAWLAEAGERRARGEPSLPSRIGIERQANPFLRVEQAAIVESLTREFGRRPEGREQAFAALRRWKDVFQ
ncbi:MAG TPA: hydroxyacylglutathione hydrolase [Arenimonas sp.]|nr:hydroxyacylglutathione hydrolase [Arenimonas sp.]